MKDFGVHVFRSLLFLIEVEQANAERAKLKLGQNRRDQAAVSWAVKRHDETCDMHLL